MPEIEIEREDQNGRGRYVARVEGLESQMTYAFREGPGGRIMSIDHTGVPKALAGLGVGLALVRRAAADARQQAFRIEPRCSFVRVMMERHADLGEVRAD
jgi:predicted GNAT family acetyltransferase